MRLAIELHGTIVGTIVGGARTFDFTPSPEGNRCEHMLAQGHLTRGDTPTVLWCSPRD